jgi:hypothetical protein
MEYLPYLQKRICTICGLDEELVRGVSEKGIYYIKIHLILFYVIYVWVFNTV